MQCNLTHLFCLKKSDLENLFIGNCTNISCFFYISANILSKILHLKGLDHLSFLYFLVVVLKSYMS